MMDLAALRINKGTIRNKNGLKYVSMVYPAGWDINITRNDDHYCGYGSPFYFHINFKSPDRLATFTYITSMSYSWDNMSDSEELIVNDYGELMFAFKNVEAYLDRRIAWQFKNSGIDYRFFRQIDYANNREKQDKLHDDVLEGYKKNYPQRVLDGVYRRGAVRLYKYIYNGMLRIRALSCIVEAEKWTDWRVAEFPFGMSVTEPLAKRLFPGLKYDGANQRYIYTLASQTDWRACANLSLDCPEEDFDKLYESLMLPAMNSGVSVEDELRREMDERQSRINAYNRRKRAEEEIGLSMHSGSERPTQDQPGSDQEFYKKSSQTANEEISITDPAYQDPKVASSSVNGHRSDIPGNNDEQGSAFVVHTTDKYAWRKGNQIYTTNDPNYSPGLGWERLEKK